MAQSGTLELVARELGQLLAPLKDRLAASGPGAPDLLSRIGVTLPASVSAQAGFVNAVAALAGAAGDLAPVVVELVDAIDADDQNRIVDAGIRAVEKAAAVIQAATALQPAVQAAANAAPLGPAEKAELLSALGDVARRLLDFLVVEYLESKSQALAQALTLLGLIERDAAPGVSGSGISPPFVRRSLRLDRLGPLLAHPDAFLADVYGWGQPGFDGRLLMTRLADLLEAYRYPFALIEAPGQPPILEAYLAALQADTSTNPPSLAVRLRFAAAQDVSRTIPVRAPWAMRVGAKARFDAGVAGRITPPLQLQLTPPTAGASLQADAALVADGGASPLLLIGQARGSRLEARRITAGASILARLEGGQLLAEPGVNASVEGGKLLIDLSQGDGFIQTILRGVKVESNFDLGLQWSPSRGVVFSGGAALELVVPLHLNLGPVELGALYFMLGVGGEAPVQLGVATSLKVQIGPFGMAIDRIGVDMPMRFPAGRDGNLGPLDLGFKLRPPTGIGVVVDAGPITGGGFLSIDTANGRYAGVLQLATPLVSVTAIGLLDTRLPDGAEGFSFLILVSVELPNIQLGFGFTLNGVGGLAGINRTVATDTLRQGIRAGALNSVMFPRDPVANAPQIIANLRSYFPPAQQRFLFGPFLKIGWGTPSLVTGSLGVVLELPDPVRILILGQLKVAVPDPALPLVSLNLDVLGIIDFGAQMLSIDASLYDSRVTTFNIYGDMALRLSWGAQPIFALAMGGLHPQFRPPPGFPDLRRLTIELAIGNNPRLTCQSYFAITSNSVQMGARVEAYAEAAGFNIRGWLGYDALLIFQPFSLLVDISAGVELRRGNSVIAGIHLNASLSGPNPWNVSGRACISLFLFDVCVPVNLTIGDKKQQPVPVLDAWDQLRKALADSRNWQGRPPTGLHRAVAYCAPADAAVTLVDPAGGLAVQQKVLPLNLQLDKLGEARIDGASRFDLSHVRIGTLGSTKSLQQDFFATGQYTQLTDAQKLSRDSYELMDAGVVIGGELVTAGDARTKALVYEAIVIDRPDGGSRLLRDYARRELAPVQLSSRDFEHMAARSRVAFAPRTGLERYAPAHGDAPRVGIGRDAWRVADADTLQAHEAIEPCLSSAAAQQQLRDWQRAHPGDARVWQVLPAHELEAA